jgi:mono/diheme cytochrome c family protein
LPEGGKVPESGLVAAARSKYYSRREGRNVKMRKGQVVGGLLVASLWLLAGTGTVFAGADEGKKVFETKKCITCHTLGSEKGPMAKLGGPLDGVGTKRDAAWLKGYLTDPKSKIPNAKMPKQKLTEKEIDDLVQYVLTLK